MFETQNSIHRLKKGAECEHYLPVDEIRTVSKRAFASRPARPCEDDRSGSVADSAGVVGAAPHCGVAHSPASLGLAVRWAAARWGSGGAALAQRQPTIKGTPALTAHTLSVYSARMMPPFNAQGDLPPGVHQATLVEVVERFGQSVPKRINVTERLRRVVALAQETGKLERVFIWGSYATDKPDPGDIDLFLIMSPDFESNAYTGEMRLVFDSEAAERELGTTVFWMTSSAGSQTTVACFLEQFRIRRDGGRRGIVEILL